MLRGIIPPMVTPLRDTDTLDVAGLEKLIEHILAGGVHGLFILGTTGEGPSHSYRLRRELIERTCRQVAGRVPVLVGITDSSIVESVNLARHSADSGATSLVFAPPFYFSPTQDELARHVEKLVSDLPLPMFLYNMPAMTKLVFEPETVRRLSACKNIIGVKDSSGDVDYFEKIVHVARKCRPDWPVLVGPEALVVKTMSLGGDGGVSGGANVYPSLFVDLFNAIEKKDAPAVDRLQKRLLHLGKLYSISGQGSASIKGPKCALSLLGICDDFMAYPFERFNAQHREEVRCLLQELGLLAAK